MSDWRDQAACLSYDPELWWPTQAGDKSLEARAICRHECPVLNECGEYAITNGETYGIWAGVTEHELVSAVRRRRRAGQERTADLLPDERRNLTARLSRMGFSNREIATSLGINRDTVSRYLRESREVS